jgi:hypothetical protein
MFSSAAKAPSVPKPTIIYIHREESAQANAWFENQAAALAFFNPGEAVVTPVMGIERSITFDHYYNKPSSAEKGIVFYVMGKSSTLQADNDLATFKAQLPAGFRVVVVTAEAKNDDTPATNCETVGNSFENPTLKKLDVINFSLPKNPPEMSDEAREKAKKGMAVGLVYLSSVKKNITSSAARRVSAALGMFKGEKAAAAKADESNQDKMQGEGTRFSMGADGEAYVDEPLTAEELALETAAADAAKEQAAKAKGAQVLKPEAVKEGKAPYVTDPRATFGDWDFTGAGLPGADGHLIMTDEAVEKFRNEPQKLGNHDEFPAAELEEERAPAAKASGNVYGKIFAAADKPAAPAAKVPGAKT